MKRTLFAAAVVASLLVSIFPVYGHHSFSATYNVDQKVTLTGKLVQISLRSPHSFFYVEVTEPNGMVRKWTIEGAAAGQFARTGSDAFKVGDPVEVQGNPSRTPNAPRAILLKITRTTDGKSWGGRPGEAVD